MSPEPVETQALRTPLAACPSQRAWSEVVRDLVTLTKPRLTGLVIFTTGVGILLAPTGLGFWKAWWTIGLTSLVVAGGSAFNQALERDADRWMERTRERPLPAGRLQPRTAWILGSTMVLLGLPLLALTVNPLTALLGAVACLLYAGVYTPLKSRSAAAVYVGAIPGATPIVMGWTAATGRLDPPVWALFAILFFWQLPHFLAIALYRQKEYGAAGIRIFPLVHGETVTRRHMLAGSLGLAAAALAPFALGLGGAFYGGLAGILSLVTVGATLGGVVRSAGPTWARRYFLSTLLYLPLLLSTLVVSALP